MAIKLTRNDLWLDHTTTAAIWKQLHDNRLIELMDRNKATKWMVSKYLFFSTLLGDDDPIWLLNNIFVQWVSYSYLRRPHSCVPRSIGYLKRRTKHKSGNISYFEAEHVSICLKQFDWLLLVYKSKWCPNPRDQGQYLRTGSVFEGYVTVCFWGPVIPNLIFGGFFWGEHKSGSNMYL